MRARRFPAAFDVVASALVINFVRDAPRAAAEMRRVAREGGIVAGFVWDFSPEIPGTSRSTLTQLQALFENAGLRRIETRTYEVTLAYRDFDDFWSAQTPSYSPSIHAIARLAHPELERAKRAVRTQLQPAQDGTIAYAARVNAIKAMA